MLHPLIAEQVAAWFARPDCSLAPLIGYMESRGALRPAQIEAIKTFLFLKIEGDNLPLHELFSRGFFTKRENLADLPLSQSVRDHFQNDIAARSLWEFARARPCNGAKPLLPELEPFLRDRAIEVDASDVARQFFGGVGYPDYLFSLPMGAGKTFLMAAFIYLELYFALKEPDNPRFAHNFIILVPSGLKSSILPSLRTIEHFDPTWVVPEPAATQLKSLLQFELLDQPKSAKKSNRARNPNAQKVASHQPFDSLMGLVLVTNAEKVILDRVSLDEQGRLFESSDDDKDRSANELRNLIGKIPRLQILIDEVHHAATDDVKLRQVVHKWNAGATVNSVLGFSGTPYLASPEKISIGPGASVKFNQISNTVFYYPLISAIQTFLKKPTVKPMSGLEPLSIVRRGVEDFGRDFGQTVYSNGTIAKLAIYCGSIERLEEEVFPFLTGEMNIPAEQILRFHKGNKTHPTPPRAALEFGMLDTSLSQHRFVLLVQIGKEGWDCPSLTGVILSQRGDCPTNMVLQTSCRCLRQVEPLGVVSRAGIWLNADNAKILDKQLAEEQQTSIAQINDIGTRGAAGALLRERFSRLDELKLPRVEFYQLRVRSQTLVVDDQAQPQNALAQLDVEAFRTHALVIERELVSNQTQKQTVVSNERGDIAHFRRWLLEIEKGGFGSVSARQLETHRAELQGLFERITFEDSNGVWFNALLDREAINARVRLSFHARRELQTRDETVWQHASLLLVEKLVPVAASKTLFPSEDETQTIRDLDASGQTTSQFLAAKNAGFQTARALLEAQGLAHMLPAPDLSVPLAVARKDHALHFLPYDFSQSKFELDFLRQALPLSDIADRDLELYYNGENHLTEFRIECFERKDKSWARVGLYTPDFLLVQREDASIKRVLIIETKGTGFGEQSAFRKRRTFVEGEFLRLNNEKFGFNRFDYLYLSDGDGLEHNLSKLSNAIKEFFV